MIEQALIFLLGFLLATLLVSGFAPFFWRRAVRLASRRLALEHPLSLREIAAERDALAAKFAVENLRLKQQAETINQKRIKDLAVLGRHTGALVQLENEYALLKSQSVQQDVEIEALKRHINKIETESRALKKELDDQEKLYTRQHEDLLALKAAHSKLLAQTNHDIALLAKEALTKAELQLHTGDRHEATWSSELEDRLRKCTDFTLEQAIEQVGEHPPNKEGLPVSPSMALRRQNQRRKRRRPLNGKTMRS